MTGHDKDIALALVVVWKNKAEALRKSDNHGSPLVKVDKMHQAQVYEECARELSHYMIDSRTRVTD